MITYFCLFFVSLQNVHIITLVLIFPPAPVKRKGGEEGGAGADMAGGNSTEVRFLGSSE